MKKIIYLALFSLLLFPVLVSANGDTMMNGFNQWPMHMSGYGSWGLLFLICIIVWIVVGILAAVWLWRKIK